MPALHPFPPPRHHLMQQAESCLSLKALKFSRPSRHEKLSSRAGSLAKF